MKEWFAGLRDRVAEAWRTSLQVRVIGSIFAATSLVMLILGMAMTSVVTQRLVDQELENAQSEITRARAAVEQQISSTSTGSSTQARVNSARAVLTSRAGQEPDSSYPYQPVLLVADRGGTVTTAPENYTIPEKLRHFVDEGTIAYQFSPVQLSDGSRYHALIIGTPTDSDIPGLQVYLVLSTSKDENTLAIMRGLIAAAVVVVLVLLVGISWLFSQQVITPVRSASRIAERLAAGHLRERMSVEGEDEMARLAVSFNSMAESLSKQINQLKEYGDLQRQFTSDVSHELRTPLTTVRMAADMIAMKSEDFDAGTKRATELMVAELDRFEDLLGDLLEISRHDAGVADLSETQLDVRLCIKDAWRQVEHLATELGIEFSFIGSQDPDQPLTITGDSRRIERVLRNLLANAIDHSEGNPVVVNWAGNDEAVAITVTDHGVGLKEGQEDLVFNRFWRADPSRKRHSGGTGLGLAIAQEDSALHGGRLDAAGTYGVGSQFRLTLPRTPNAPYQTSPLDLEAPTS
ncbi:MtrAB system histidine kinase MtrB [Corynebacterium uberis]|uniref:MtrAB system histidine kinase MtrB n=1 Tax=Corynebacterium uberis TaxID=2883169 RepID=UPI0024B104BB|nr:MtrAB system histidine kinase MtrB [Corynebacterium uberis]